MRKERIFGPIMVREAVQLQLEDEIEESSSLHQTWESFMRQSEQESRVMMKSERGERKLETESESGTDTQHTHIETKGESRVMNMICSHSHNSNFLLDSPSNRTLEPRAGVALLLPLPVTRRSRRSEAENGTSRRRAWASAGSLVYSLLDPGRDISRLDPKRPDAGCRSSFFLQHCRCLSQTRVFLLISNQWTREAWLIEVAVCTLLPPSRSSFRS